MEALDPDSVRYPESDGQRMADNTTQFAWIVLLKESLDALLSSDFVAGDLFWYPVRGEPNTRVAPDVLVALGRPKGHRGSYRTWEEDDVVPQVVMEVLSPGNTVQEMRLKLAFYDRHGVDEFYLIDPDVETFEVFVRAGGSLREVPFDNAFTSPALGIRFVREDERLQVLLPDGSPMLPVPELIAGKKAAEAAAQVSEAARMASEAARAAVEAERDAIKAKYDRLQAQLRALGIEPD